MFENRFLWDKARRRGKENEGETCGSACESWGGVSLLSMLDDELYRRVVVDRC